MKRSYYTYCRFATVAFLIATVYPVTINLARHQIAHDWFHSLLHALSAVGGAYAGWLARSVGPAKLFTWTIGVLYLGLGIYGGFTPGLLMSSPLAIPLSASDNIFHLALSAPALAIATADLWYFRRSLRVLAPK